jgi:hypothetical protein
VEENGGVINSNVVAENLCSFHDKLSPEDALINIQKDFADSTAVSKLLVDLSVADTTLKNVVITTETGREIPVTEANSEILRSIYPEAEFPSKEAIKKEYLPTFGRDEAGLFTVTFQESSKKEAFITEAGRRNIPLRFL